MTDSTQEDRMPQDAVDEVVAEIDLDAQGEPAEAETPEAGSPEAESPEAETPEGGRREPAAGTELLVQEGDAAADYLEGLLDIADLDGDIDIDVEGDRALVSIVEASPGDLGHLVGDGGEVLDAMQDLARLAATRETGERSRLMLDVAGYRAEKRRALEKVGTEAAERARETGQPVRLEPMTPFERKVVHDAVAAAGLVSESEGEEPQRRVVVRPA